MENRVDARAEPENVDAGGRRTSIPDSIAALGIASRAWSERGTFTPLERWLTRELDASGVPIRVPISDWTSILIELAQARRARKEWPERCNARIAAFVEAALKFARPGGIAAATEFERHESSEIRDAFRLWASANPGTGLSRVVSMWFPRRDDDESSPPPLPAWSSAKQPLAILRAEWLKTGDFLAVDHRAPGPSTSFELFGGGKSWLGPQWSLSLGDGTESTRPKIRAWSTSSTADLFEWTFRVGADRVTRTAVLLRGRRMGFFSDQLDFGSGDGEGRPVSMRLAHVPAVRTEGDEESRTLVLRRSDDRASARAYPLGLPCLPYKTDKGSFHASDGQLVVSQARTSRKILLPILVSWDAARNRKPVQWRALTVSERSKACDPSLAVAFRARWGQDETIVVYRSLGKPGLRAFLGHQTKARFLVGSFSAEGVLKPLVSLE